MRTRTPVWLIGLSLSAAVWAADTPRAGWYEVSTEYSVDGQQWRAAPARQAFCALGLGEAELEQVYRAAFEREGCRVQRLRIADGRGEGVAQCRANGHPAQVQIQARYDARGFETQADSQGRLVVEQNQSLPFRMLSRSQGQRSRDCSEAERAASRALLQGR